MRWKPVILTGCILVLAGCSASGELAIDSNTFIPTSDARPSDESLALGRMHFEKASYGMAERQYRASVEANPHSVDGWLGLAASYDRLARFELAERAYERAAQLGGHTSVLMNNLGYHHMLRGNLGIARTHLEAAAKGDPGNPSIQGNLRLLETWKAAPDAAHDQSRRG